MKQFKNKNLVADIHSELETFFAVNVNNDVFEIYSKCDLNSYSKVYDSARLICKVVKSADTIEFNEYVGKLFIDTTYFDELHGLITVIKNHQSC